jgi:predicted NAD/FAD-binding protein
MLAAPSVMEQEVLSCFQYQYNHTVVHSDETVMPKVKRCWAAWNVRIDEDSVGGDSLLNSTHYWMNRLQHLPQKPFYAVSLNAAHLIDPEKIHRVIDYHHPRFTVDAVRAQQYLPQLNQQSEAQRLFFCGSYFKYGFHEDAYTAGLTLANQLKQKLA